MARARNIKPGFFTNDELAECQPLARLLFVGLWTIADREGRLEDRPKKIKAEILPYDDCSIEALLDELGSRVEDDGKPAFIMRYEVNGKKCIQIMHFKQHQNPHMKEATSTIPAPDLHCTSTIQEQGELGAQQQEESDKTSKIAVLGLHHTSTVLAPEKHQTSPADSLLPITESLLPHPSIESIVAREEKPVDNFGEGTDLDGRLVDGGICPSGNDVEETTSAAVSSAEPSIPDQQFTLFWTAYPRRMGEKRAREAWESLMATGVDPGSIVIAAQRYCAKVKVEKTEEAFVTMPHNFLTKGMYKEYLLIKEPCPKCGDLGWYVDEVKRDWGGTISDRVTCDCRKRKGVGA